MLSPDALRMLDTTVWLRSGEKAAQRLHCSQSTVSRNNVETLALFDLALERVRGEWQFDGDSTLLFMERRVHQFKRLQRDPDSHPSGLRPISGLHRHFLIPCRRVGKEGFGITWGWSVRCSCCVSA